MRRCGSILGCAVALVALVSLAPGGCGPGECEQHDLKDIPLAIQDRLNDVHINYQERGDYPDGALVAVGDGGVILVAPSGYAPLPASRPVDVDLHAALLGPDDQVFVAGAGGTLLRGVLGSDAWTPIATGTTAALHELAWIRVGTGNVDGSVDREYQIAVGDDVVLVRDESDGSWDAVPPPPGGWGELRAVVGDDWIHVAGLGGVIWSAPEPDALWVRADAGTTADLLAGDRGWSDEAVLVGARGTILHRVERAWVQVPSTIGPDLIVLDWILALTSDGRVYDLALLDHPELEAWTAPWARSLAYGGQLVLVGDAGRAARIAVPTCD